MKQEFPQPIYRIIPKSQSTLNVNLCTVKLDDKPVYPASGFFFTPCHFLTVSVASLGMKCIRVENREQLGTSPHTIVIFFLINPTSAALTMPYPISQNEHFPLFLFL